jgi:hypothetical protein
LQESVKDFPDARHQYSGESMIRKRVAIVLVLLLVYVGGSSWLSNRSESAQLNELRALGVPTTQAEYDRLTGTPDPAATELYDTIRQKLDTSSNTSAGLPLRKTVLPAQRIFLVNNERTLALLEEASKLGRPEYYDSEMHPDYEGLVAPHRFKAFVNAYDGDDAGALGALKTLDRITQQFLHLPGSGSMQAETWIFGLTPKILLREARDDRQALAAINKYLGERPALRTPREALLDDYLELDRGYTRAREMGFAYAWRYMGPLGKAARSANREILIALFQNLSDDTFDWKRDEALAAKVAKVASKTGRLGRSAAVNYAYSVESQLEMTYKVECFRRMERLAGMVLLERLERGALPKSFACPPEIKDPHTGGVFRYKALGDGFMLYSCGPDGVDGGGVTLGGVSDDIALGIQW